MARIARSVPAMPRQRRPGHRPCRPRMNRRAVWREISTDAKPSGARLSTSWPTCTTRTCATSATCRRSTSGATRSRRASSSGTTRASPLVELAPGAIVPEHRHEHEQLGMCIEGSITFTIDGERRALGPGGTWRIPSNLPHDAVAGPEGAIVVDIFSPVRADWDALPRSAPRAARWPRAPRLSANAEQRLSCSAPKRAAAVVRRPAEGRGRARRSRDAVAGRELADLALDGAHHRLLHVGPALVQALRTAAAAPASPAPGSRGSARASRPQVQDVGPDRRRTGVARRPDHVGHLRRIVRQARQDRAPCRRSPRRRRRSAPGSRAAAGAAGRCLARSAARSRDRASGSRTSRRPWRVARPRPGRRRRGR